MRLTLLASHLAMLSIFSAGFSTRLGPVLAATAVVLLTVAGRRVVSKWLLLILFGVLGHGLLNVWVGNTTLLFFGKTYLAMTTYFLAFNLLMTSGQSLNGLFRLYVKYASVVAALGLLQVGCWNVGVPACYDFSYIFPNSSVVPGQLLGIRASSVLPEPSHVAFSLGPAIAASILQVARTGRTLVGPWSQALLLVFALLSQSSTVYVIVLATGIGAIAVLRRKTGIALAVVAVIGVGTWNMASIPGFVEPTLEKAEGLQELVTYGADAEGITSTTYAIYANGRLALSQAAETWGVGGGLGSHQVYLAEMVETLHAPVNVRNQTSAANLVFRLLSELGVVGVLLVLGVLLAASRKIVGAPNDQRTILIALLMGVVAFCIRNGALGHYGLAFYVSGLLWGRTERYVGASRFRVRQREQTAVRDCRWSRDD